MPTSASPSQPSLAAQTVMSFFAVVRRLATAGPQPSQHPKTWPLLGRLAQVRSMRVADLADFAGLDASTMSRHVRALEQDGLVARDTDPDDRRAASIRLTDQGRAFMQEALRQRADVLAAATATWSERDRAQLAGLLARLAAALQPDHDRPTEPTESSTHAV